MEEDFEGLILKTRKLENAIAKVAAEKENILIVSHYGADGICASALLQYHIFANGGHCQVRWTGQPNYRNLERIGASNFGLTIFVDLGSGLCKELSKIFGDKWFAIDHHEIDADERDSQNLLNCFQYGYDGSRDVSSSGLCFFATEKTRSSHSAFFAIVGALSDEQDLGHRRSLVSLNSAILDIDSTTQKTLDSRVDLLFSGRERLPIHESIANTISCFIPGLTGNKDACLASLRSAGVDLKSNIRWRTLSELGEEEKQRLLESIVPHLQGTTISVQDLVGSLYSFNAEDEYSPLRDARDLASLLNSLGSSGRPGLGLSLCFGAGADMQSEIEKSVLEYKMELIRTVQTMTSNEDRILEKNSYVLVIGDGAVNDRLTGACCRIMSTLTRVRNRVVILRTTTQDGEVKISARQTRDSSNYDLGSTFRSLARSVGGIGGGLRNVAGAKFSIAKQQEFQAGVDSVFQTQKSPLRQS